MFWLIFSLFYLDYIPKEFQQLKRKAIRSSQLKLLSNEDPEPIISPEKPLVTDSFIGTVFHPIFGITTKELKGYALSKTKEHIAIIADRETKSGRSILEENSVFFGEGNISVSLSKKYADDGEVAIYNITKIDPLEAFYNFDIKLSSFSPNCGAPLGKSFGARCRATWSESWEDDHPKEIDLKGVDSKIKEKVKLYAGFKVTGEASAIVEKRGSSIQAKFDGSLKVLAGAGFHIDQFHYSLDSQELFSHSLPLGSGTVKILSIPISLSAKFQSSIYAKNISFDIPHDITISRQVSIDLHKSYTISSKHGESSDSQKEIKIGSIQTNSKEKGMNTDEESFQAQFDCVFTVRAGIRVELSVSTNIDFSAEVGPEVGLKLQLGIDSKKCTFPALYGSFTPFINTYCIFEGRLSIAGIQLVKFNKPIIYNIYEKNIFNDCFFDSASSKELDNELIQVERSRHIIEINNPIIVNKSKLINPKMQSIIYLGSKENEEKIIFLGLSIYYIDNDQIKNPNDYLIIPESKNINNMELVIITKDDYLNNDLGDDSSHDFPYPPKEIVNISTSALTFNLMTKKSNIIEMGKQFDITNVNDYLNFKNNFANGGIEKQKVALILKSESEGYYVRPYEYYFVDEIDGFHTDYLYKWVKIEVLEIIGETNASFHIYRFDKELNDFFLEGINSYVFDGKNKPMKQEFLDNYAYLKLYPNRHSDDVIAYIELRNPYSPEHEIVGSLKLTDEDISIVEPFIKEIGPYKVTLKCNTDIDQIEYIGKLNDEYIKVSPTNPMKGFVVRTFTPHNNNNEPKPYINSPITIDGEMQDNERYGNLQYTIQDPGYDIENNDNVFAFLKLPRIVPLLKNVENVDAKNELYVIKLEYSKNVFKDDQFYIFNIPFRTRETNSISINAILYKVYQSYEVKDEDKDNNKKFNPFCPAYPTFNLKIIPNYYVGCVRIYTEPSDFSENKWIHYPQNVEYSYTDLPDEKNREKGKPFGLLHIIFAPTSNTKESEIINVFAKQNYFNFPEKERLMVIDNETIENMNRYAQGTRIEIKCKRCKSIHVDKYPEGRQLTKNGDFYALYLTHFKKEFILEATCNSEKDKHCTFEYDLSNDGVSLLEYNSGSDGFEPKRLLEEGYDDLDKGKSEFPGVEEIYDIESETEETSKYRLNINCRRQIVPERKGKIYLTKPWEGNIKKVATHLENSILNIKIAEKEHDGYTKIFMYEPELKSIPFNPNFLAYDNEDKIKNDLAQLGIKTNGKTIKELIQNNDLIVDNEGHILVRNDFFDGKQFKESINQNDINLISIPKGKYTLKHVKCEIKTKKAACNSGTKEVKDDDYDDETCQQPMVNFEIKAAYLGSSKVFENNFIYNSMKKLRKYFGHIIPSPNAIHTGIWVGESDASDNSIGTVLTYGNYHPDGKDSTYISKDGARAFTVTLGEFKEMFEISDVKKLIPQRNISLFNLINEIKANEKWRAKHYSWSSNNCQHFTLSCLNILKAKRVEPAENDWINFPKKVLNALKENENAEIFN